MKRQLPQPVNWAQPQWRHAASGIRCRADWKNAYVYDTQVGLIIAYNQAHADDRARDVLENNEEINTGLDNKELLWELAE